VESPQCASGDQLVCEINNLRNAFVILSSKRDFVSAATKMQLRKDVRPKAIRECNVGVHVLRTIVVKVIPFQFYIERIGWRVRSA